MHDPQATSAVVAETLDHLPPPPAGGTHIAEAPSGSIGPNAAVIAIILLCGLICGLALNVAIRCFLRGPDTTSSTPRKPPEVAPRGPFAWETSLARKEDDVCAVCLTEFVEGESIKVLGKCKHGFHVECIEKWLWSHSCCPTCRTSCLLEDESSSTSSSSQVLEIEGHVNNVCEQCDEYSNGSQSVNHGRAQQSRVESV